MYYIILSKKMGPTALMVTLGRVGEVGHVGKEGNGRLICPLSKN